MLTSNSFQSDTRRWQAALKPYLVAVIATAAAAALRSVFDPIFEDHHIFLFFILASIYVAWHDGWTSAVFAMLLGLLTTAYLFADPRCTFAMEKPEHYWAIPGYFLVTGLGIVMSESRRRAQSRAERHTEKLQAEIDAHNATDRELKFANGKLREVIAQLEALAAMFPRGAGIPRHRISFRSRQ